jgi:hypothetical protein
MEAHGTDHLFAGTAFRVAATRSAGILLRCAARAARVRQCRNALRLLQPGLLPTQPKTAPQCVTAESTPCGVALSFDQRPLNFVTSVAIFGSRIRFFP